MRTGGRTGRRACRKAWRATFEPAGGSAAAGLTCHRPCRAFRRPYPRTCGCRALHGRRDGATLERLAADSWVRHGGGTRTGVWSEYDAPVERLDVEDAGAGRVVTCGPRVRPAGPKRPLLPGRRRRVGMRRVGWNWTESRFPIGSSLRNRAGREKGPPLVFTRRSVSPGVRGTACRPVRPPAACSVADRRAVRHGAERVTAQPHPPRNQPTGRAYAGHLGQVVIVVPVAGTRPQLPSSSVQN